MLPRAALVVRAVPPPGVIQAFGDITSESGWEAWGCPLTPFPRDMPLKLGQGMDLAQGLMPGSGLDLGELHPDLCLLHLLSQL